ncbi:MAG: ABC transporter permease [Spirochaetaceae bacterium]|nr:ABC transporter permease [Spirochaetaceae bacterium]
MNHNIAHAVRENRGLSLIARNWAAFFLLGFLVIFSFTGKGFLSLSNFQNVIHLGVIAVLMACAETFVIITGGIDLSIGFVMGFSSVTAGKIIQVLYAGGEGTAPGIAIAVGVAAVLVLSLIPGLVSGILIARYRVPPFIATLGMWGITNGIALKISEGFPVATLPDVLTRIGNGYVFYAKKGMGVSLFGLPEGIGNESIRQFSRLIPNSFLFLALVLLVLWHLLKNTTFGQHTYAIGGSEEAALRSGIDVKRHLVKIYVLSSFIAGLAGIFNVFQTGIGNFTPFGAMYELFAVAAVVIGGASLMGGKGTVIGSLIGVLMIAFLENGLLISGVEPFYRFIAVGLLLIIAVVIDQLFPDLL